jgi:hypothetical protein
MRFILLSVAAACGLSSHALAQNFNVDCGTLTPTPSPSFGAASGQTGFWNAYAGGALGGLVTTSGGASSVSITGTGGFLGGYNDPGTFGDDEALMDDSLIVPFWETYTISGLAAGSYDVYVYVWTQNALPTGVDVQGQGMQAVGGAWAGGYATGVTHALASVTLAPSQALIIDIHSINGALGGFCGFQIVEVPGPSGLAVLAGAAAARGRRRHA